MTSRFLIYGLIDPRSGELRYVGKSASGAGRRVSQHLTSARRGGRQHVYCWLRQLLDLGLKPDIEVLESPETAEALNETERHFIAYFRSIGCRLTNLTDGGEGASGYRHTAEQRARNAAARRGKPLSASHRASLSAAGLGRKLTAADGMKISQGLTGRKHTIEHTLNSSRAHGGRCFVDQHGATYQTRSQAAAACGALPSSVTGVLSGRRRSVRGYVFSYPEEREHGQ